MMIGVFIPATASLHAALRTRVARDAIAAGMGLYTDGVRTMLLPAPLPGWFRVAVTLRDSDPSDDQLADEEAA